MELLFQIGQTVATPGALEAFDAATMRVCLQRHMAGDWGDIDREDARANDAALRDGERLLSVYKLPPVGTLWIITEADRSATTFLLPIEY